jgi:hypothetical protein
MKARIFVLVVFSLVMAVPLVCVADAPLKGKVYPAERKVFTAP